MALFNWFRGQPKCPIDAALRQWLDERWDWLIEEFGINRLRGAAVVLPDAEFFPDHYEPSETDSRLVLDRVCGYMGLDPQWIEMTLFAEQRSSDIHPLLEGKWNGAAGLYREENGVYQIFIEARLLDDPIAMVATMAHELGHVHLLGHGRVSPEADDHEPLTDLLTVFFGMGVITSNSVVREWHWQDGSYAGWQVSRQGYLTMPTYGYALAKFAHTRGEENPRWSRHLRPDVRAAFKQSMQLLASEPE